MKMFLLYLILALPNLELHKVTIVEKEPEKSIVVIPQQGIEYWELDNKYLVLHPVKEGNYSFLTFKYNKETSKVDVEIEVIEIGNSPLPPQPVNDIKEAIKQGFKNSINDAKIADTISKTIIAVLKLEINNPKTLRETLRYNMRLRLGNNYVKVDSEFDDAILAPIIKRENPQTLEDYRKLYTTIAEALSEVAQ